MKWKLFALTLALMSTVLPSSNTTMISSSRASETFPGRWLQRMRMCEAMLMRPSPSVW